MIERLLTASAALLVVAACGETPAEPTLDREPVVAFAATPIKFPLSAVYPPYCGESIALEGVARLVLSNFTDENGRFHSVYRFTMTGRGVGLTTGAQYTYRTSSLQLIQSGEPLVLRTIETVNLVGLGATPDLRIRVGIAVTMDSNGELRVDFYNVDGSCS